MLVCLYKRFRFQRGSHQWCLADRSGHFNQFFIALDICTWYCGQLCPLYNHSKHIDIWCYSSSHNAAPISKCIRSMLIHWLGAFPDIGCLAISCLLKFSDVIQCFRCLYHLACILFMNLWHLQSMITWRHPADVTRTRADSMVTSFGHVQAVWWRHSYTCR